MGAVKGAISIKDNMSAVLRSIKQLSLIHI